MPGVDSAGFADLQTESACSFQTLVEDQPIEVVGQVAKGQFRLSAGEADGADEQVEPVLLMREDMLNMRTDRGFGGIGPRGCLRHRLAHGFAPMNTGREHLVRQPLLVAPGSIGTVCPDLGTGIVRADDLPEKTPVRR
mgnify:CR=1 FL=1